MPSDTTAGAESSITLDQIYQSMKALKDAASEIPTAYLCHASLVHRLRDALDKEAVPFGGIDSGPRYLSYGSPELVVYHDEHERQVLKWRMMLKGHRVCEITQEVERAK